MRLPADPRRRNAFFGILLGITNVVCLAGGVAVGRLVGGRGATEVDLGVARDSVKAVPFYELVFDPEAPASMHPALLPDPITKVRPRPLHPGNRQSGPHDILGFRGTGVPNTFDIVTIGDSQTYGWGVPLEDNWPSQLAARSGRTVYNMAVGGWGGAQYRYVAEKALRFAPQQLVVGLYMGNDAIESLTQVYAAAEFTRFRVAGHATLQGFDLKFEREAPEAVQLPDRKVEFTPGRRWFVNNRDNPAVPAGYRLLADLAEDLAATATAARVPVLFVIVPTKERVYAPMLAALGTAPSKTFVDLVAHEGQNTAELIARLQAAGCQVVDTTPALQDAVAAGVATYPDEADGHPSAAGYRIVAQAVADRLAATPTPPRVR